MYWGNIVNKLQIKTPDEETNIMLNGWNVYQTMVSRLYAKTGYYQSGVTAAALRNDFQPVSAAAAVIRVLSCVKNPVKIGEAAAVRTAVGHGGALFVE